MRAGTQPVFDAADPPALARFWAKVTRMASDPVEDQFLCRCGRAEVHNYLVRCGSLVYGLLRIFAVIAAIVTFAACVEIPR